MSLRVLLADESASIKKVFQLGLQDYGAEVKTVQSGIDVVEVAEKFSPDIIFADILLQKQNGYEVCEEIKKHQNLRNVPFVLMWSSFMELDRQRFSECHADGEIEKPFEVDALREHIQQLVAKTRSQQLSSFLEFPASINQEFIEEENAKAMQHLPPMESPIESGSEEDSAQSDQGTGQVIYIPPTVAIDEQETEISSVFNRPEFDLEATADEDQELQMESVAPPTMDQGGGSEFAEWEVKTHTQYQAITPLADEGDSFQLDDNWQSAQLSSPAEPEVESQNQEADVEGFSSFNIIDPPEEKLELDDFLYKPGEEEAEPAQSIPVANVSVRNMDEEDGVGEESAPMVRAPSTEQLLDAVRASLPMDEIEAIVRAHTQELIKLNIMDELPKVIERIAREELEKILKEELANKVGLGGQS